jgi:nucleotide-binding universal stress UspA family protein
MSRIQVRAPETGLPLGSTAAAAAHGSPAPVLVVPGGSPAGSPVP